MREWKGQKDGATQIGGDWPITALGVRYHISGELRRRQGLTKLCDIGGAGMGVFTDVRGVTWLIVVESDGEIRAVNLATPTATTVIKSGYDTTNVATLQPINGRMYITNGVDPLQVWNGISATTYDAGITGPSAAPGAPTTASGNGTAGTHLIRYRYYDATSPASSYRSDASPNLTQVVTASGTDGQMTFSIGSSGTNLIWSTDAKVTGIIVEMTPIDSGTFRVAATCSNTATSVVVNISDANLVLQDRGDQYDTNNDVFGDDLGGGHELPPLGTIITQCQDHTFIAGDNPVSKTVLTTNGSTTVGGSSFSALLAGRYTLRVGTAAIAYGIESVVASGTALTLANAYTGSTATAATASIVAKNPNQIYWCGVMSGATMPESYRILGRARNALNAVGDKLRGITEFNGNLVICGRFSMQQLVYLDDPGTGNLYTVKGQFGVFNQRCFVQHEGMLFGFGPNGLWMSQGGRPRWISDDIDATWADSADLSLDAQYHGSFDPNTKTVRWFFVADGESTPRNVVAYDLMTQNWYQETYRAGIDGSTTAVNNDGQLQAILSDATNGRTFTQIGATDGVPSSSTGAYTGASGSTTTVTQVNESLPTGTLADLSGLILYRPGTGEEKAITSNTSSAITHAAFSTAVASGEAIYAGAIPVTYETSWFVGEGLADAKRAVLIIECVPSGDTAAKARVYIYRDQSATPVVWTREAESQFPKGVTVVNQQSYFEVDFASTTNTSGYLKAPLPLDWSRSIKAKVQVLTPAGTLRLLDVRFELPTRRDSKPKVTNE